MTPKTATGSAFPAAELMRAIYDAYMQNEEADLVTANMETLQEKYASETSEEKTARLARYKKVIGEFQKKWGTLMGEWKSEILSFQKKALQAEEGKSHMNESKILEDIESSFSND